MHDVSWTKNVVFVKITIHWKLTAQKPGIPATLVFWYNWWKIHVWFLEISCCLSMPWDWFACLISSLILENFKHSVSHHWSLLVLLWLNFGYYHHDIDMRTRFEKIRGSRLQELCMHASGKEEEQHKSQNLWPTILTRSVWWLVSPAVVCPIMHSKFTQRLLLGLYTTYIFWPTSRPFDAYLLNRNRLKNLHTRCPLRMRITIITRRVNLELLSCV